MLCIFLLCNFFGNGQKNENLSYYNDTTFELNGYTVSLKNTYTRKKMFLKTTVSINNSTDKFILIDPRKVFYNSQSINNRASSYKRTIVIPPGYSKKFQLRFGEIEQGSPSVSFDFSEIKMSKSPIMSINDGTVAVINDRRYKGSNIIAEVIDVKPHEEGSLVKVKFEYKGENFMAVNYNNIAIKNKKGDVCYNLKKPVGKFHIDPYRKEEVVSLLFSKTCSKHDGSKKIMLFDNVFTEYSLEEVKGFKVNLHFLSEKELMDEVQENDIETID